MSATIEHVMELAENYRYEARAGEVCHRWAELRAALTALVAQARDEEAEACAALCESDYQEGIGAHRTIELCFGQGGVDCAEAIRARIAGRKA